MVVFFGEVSTTCLHVREWNLEEIQASKNITSSSQLGGSLLYSKGVDKDGLAQFVGQDFVPYLAPNVRVEEPKYGGKKNHPMSDSWGVLSLIFFEDFLEI
jgi:hypothetical protein